MRRCSGAGPAHRAKHSQRIQQRLRVHGIDRFSPFDPRPLLLVVAHERELAIGRDRQLVDVVRLEPEDRQLLPLQRIGENIVEQTAAHGHDERLFAEPRENVVAIHFPKRDRRERMFAGNAFGRVLRSERRKRHLKLRLIESVLRQIRRHVFHELRHLLGLQQIQHPIYFR